MRTLMIAAATTAALMAGSAFAAGSGSGSGTTNPPYSGSTMGNSYDRMPDGTSGSTGAGSTGAGSTTNTPDGWSGGSGSSATGSGSSYGGANPPDGLGPLSPQQNQTATGTHCPPGRPNCGPDPD